MAIEIVGEGEKTYADILRAARSQIDPNAIGVKVTSVRTTRGGKRLLVECDRAQPMVEAVRAVVGTSAKVTLLAPFTNVEILDLDSAVEGDDVARAVALAAGCPSGEVKLKHLRKGYSGTQRALLALPAKAAKKLLSLGKVAIGGVKCWVRHRIEVGRCYKCQGYGHTAASCSGTIDRSNECWRCGTAGHKSKECRAEKKTD